MATCSDSLIRRDFQQPERSATPGVLTSMQLPHRTVSFIMKGLERAPTQQDTRVHAHARPHRVRSDVLRVTSDEQQPGRSRAAEHFPSVTSCVKLHREFEPSICSASTTSGLKMAFGVR